MKRKKNKAHKLFLEVAKKTIDSRSWSVLSARDRHPSQFGSEMIYNSDYLMT